MKAYFVAACALVVLSGCATQSSDTLKYENVTGQLSFATLEEAFHSSLNMRCTGHRNDTGWQYGIYISNGRIRLERESELMVLRYYVTGVRNLPLPLRLNDSQNEYIYLQGTTYIAIAENGYMLWFETKEKDYANFNITQIRTSVAPRDFFKDSLVGYQIRSLDCTVQMVPDAYFDPPPWQT